MSTNVSWPVIAGTTYSVPAAGEVNWPALSNFLIALGNTAQSTTSQKIAIRTALTTPVTVVSASDCVVMAKLSVPGAVAVTLPAGIIGQYFIVGDGTGDASTNPITITPQAGETINNAGTYVITKDNGAVLLVFDSSTLNWSIVAEFASSSSSGQTIIVADDKFTIFDDADPTKQMQFQVASVTTGQTRVYSVPDANTTLVGTDVTQTLTNKTLGSTNVLTGATAASFTNTGTVTLFTATDTVVGRATTDTLTNKTMGSSNTLTGATAASFTNTGVVTLFTATDTVVGRATTDTLTNKSIDGGTNTLTNIPLTTAVTGILPSANGGTGVNNGGTITIGADDLSIITSGVTTLTVPTTGTVATLTGTEVFTNKDIDGGVAADDRRITIPADTLANLTALTRKAGTILYGTDTELFYLDNGTILVALASSALVGQGTPGSVAAAGQLLGTDTNDNAASGYVGEYIENVNTGSSLSSGNWVDSLTISLTAGDWDVTGIALMGASGSAPTEARVAVSLFSGNTTTDQIGGSNEISFTPPTTASNSTGVVANYRILLAAPATVYLKTYLITAGAAGQVCRISARRMR